MVNSYSLSSPNTSQRLKPDVNQRMHQSFHEYYMYTASQKFFFFADPYRRNTISVKKLVHCSVMEELQYLLRHARRARATGNFNDDDNDKMANFDQFMEGNWFCGSNALKIYSLFLDLDQDQNGNIDLIAFLSLTWTHNISHVLQERLVSTSSRISQASPRNRLRELLSLVNSLTQL